MLIGILSDSHNHCEPVRRALALFDSLGVTQLIHCGDVGGTGVFDEFVGRDLAFVWGNTDYPEEGLLAYLDTVGIGVPDRVPVRLTLDGKTFAVFHGHERGFDSAIASLDVDYILHGHSHIPHHDLRGKTHIVNPGALHRTRQKTVATLDTAMDKLTFHNIA